MISYWNKYYTFNKSPVKPFIFTKFKKENPIILRIIG